MSSPNLVYTFLVPLPLTLPKFAGKHTTFSEILFFIMRCRLPYYVMQFRFYTNHIIKMISIFDLFPKMCDKLGLVLVCFCLNSPLLQIQNVGEVALVPYSAQYLSLIHIQMCIRDRIREGVICDGKFSILVQLSTIGCNLII